MSVAITKVGSGSSNNSGTVVTATMSAGIAIGERAVFAVNAAASQAVSSFVDSKGNTWTQLALTSVLGGNRTAIYSSVLTTALVAADTITLTWAVAVRFSVPRVYKVTGAKTSNPTVTTALAYNNGIYWMGSPVTGPVNGGMALQIAGQNASSTSMTPGTGWTELHDDGVTHGSYDMSNDLNPTEGPITPLAISTSNGTGSSIGIVFEDVNTPSAPVSHLGAEIKSYLSSLIVDFTDQSTGYPASWLWDFGDGLASTAQNPQHVYTRRGTYTVQLTTTNAGGSDSESMDVNVGEIATETVPPTQGQLWPRRRSTS